MYRKKVCVLTPRFPYPVIGGDRLRIFEICKELSKFFDVTLLSLCESQEELDFVVPDDGVFKRIERVLLKPWQSKLNCSVSIFKKLPLQNAYYYSEEFQQLVNAEISKHDVFVAHLVRVADYIIDKSVPKIIEMTDAISLNYSRFNPRNAWDFLSVRSLIYMIEHSRLLKYEISCAAKFDGVSLVSNIDRDYLIEQGGAGNFVVCSNGVRLEQFPILDGFPKNTHIAFVGNMYSVQNLDAVWYFAKSILPRLRREGDFYFKVIGRIRDSDARRLSSVDGVVVRANVASVSKELEASFAAVAPVRVGAGVQNKVLEYMASAIPTVSSRIAAEGLDAVDGRDFLVANDENEFVQHVLSIWENRGLASNLSVAGREYVERHHSWSNQLEAFVSVVQGLCEPNRLRAQAKS